MGIRSARIRFLAVVGVLFACVAISPSFAAASRVYHPKPGSAVRKHLMSAAHKYEKTEDYHDHAKQYVVHEIDVYGSWAVGELTHRGEEHHRYSDVYAWHRVKGHWRCLVGRGDIGPVSDPRGALRRALRDLGMPSRLVRAFRFK